MTLLGIIGGSGLYSLPELTGIEQLEPETPFGKPSSPITIGSIGSTRLAFLARHGIGHVYTPSEVPYRANIFAMRELGVTHLLSVSAVGSLREHLPPGTAVVPDQVIDRTVSRPRSFFGNGVVAHVGLADPFCPEWRTQVYDAARSITSNVADGGTYVCIEGPQFSTRAESHLYRSWNCDVIGMTAMPEVRLAREAEIPFAMLAMVTDFDVWHESEEDVSVQAVQRIMADNTAKAREIVKLLAASILTGCASGCTSALEHAVITSPDHLSPEATRLMAAFGLSN